MRTTTKKGHSFIQLSKPLITVLALIVGGLALAITDAGTVIKNLATVTYTDSDDNEYIATSNEAQVIVANVYEALLTTDNSVLGQVGDTVYLPHTITNTGNASDTYTIGEATTVTGAATVGATTVYVDTNGNGQVDVGEPTLAALGNVTPSVAAGETLQLIVAVDVTAGADTDTVVVRLTATSTGDGQLLDEVAGGAGSGTGGTEPGNNLDTITLTSAAILQATKSSSFVDADTLQYVLTVENTGGASLANVQVFEAFPAGLNPATFQIQSVTGLSATDEYYTDGGTYVALGGTFPLVVGLGLATDLDEPTAIDMNGNGVAAEANQSGFLLRDDSLASGATISVTFTIDILTASLADTFKNVFCAGTGITNAAALNLGTAPNECSNQTIDRVDPTYSVQITDTGDTVVNGTNDPVGGTGTDADTIDNDVQYVAEANMTDVVEYKVYLKNNGNRPDVLDVAVANDGTFPANTVFTFFNETGNVPLVDNNNNGTVDVGLLAPGEDVIIVVRAHLPVSITTAENFTGVTATEAGGGTILAANGTSDLVLVGGEYFIDVNEDDVQQVNGADNFLGNAVSTEFPNGTPTQLNDSEVFAAVVSATSSGNSGQVDYVVVALGKIIAYRFDLANSQDSTNVVPDFILAGAGATNNAHDGGVIITAGNADLNDAFDENGSNNPSPVNSGNGAGDEEVARGETVVFPLFIRNNGSLSDTYALTAPAVAGFTITLRLPGGGAATASSGVLAPGAVYAYEAAVEVLGSAGNGTATFSFVAASGVSTEINAIVADLSDTVQDAINVEVAVCTIGVSASAPLEVNEGNSQFVNFTHTITNNYTVSNEYTLSSAITEFETAGWTTTLYQTDGTSLLSAIDSSGTAGTQIDIAAGASYTFVQRLTTPPAGAALNETAVGTVTIDATLGLCTDETVLDVATVTIANVDLVKSVALDTNCNCVSDTAEPGYSTAAGTQLPGACVVWRLEATNTSGGTITNVVIRDPLSQFTKYQADGTYNDSNNLPGYTGVSSGTPPTTVPASGQYKYCSDDTNLASVCDDGVIPNDLVSVTVGAVLAITNSEEAVFSMGTLANGENAIVEICEQIQ